MSKTTFYVSGLAVTLLLTQFASYSAYQSSSSATTSTAPASSTSTGPAAPAPIAVVALAAAAIPPVPATVADTSTISGSVPTERELKEAARKIQIMTIHTIPDNSYEKLKIALSNVDGIADGVVQKCSNHFCGVEMRPEDIEGSIDTMYDEEVASIRAAATPAHIKACVQAVVSCASKTEHFEREFDFEDEDDSI